MEIGNQVFVEGGSAMGARDLCLIVDLPSNRDPKPCACGRPKCRSFQTLAFVGKAGILRHVGECRMALCEVVLPN